MLQYHNYVINEILVGQLAKEMTRIMDVYGNEGWRFVMTTNVGGGKYILTFERQRPHPVPT